MPNLKIAFCLMLAATGIGGCAMPIHSALVPDPPSATPVRGFRYKLREPVFEIGLRLKEKEAGQSGEEEQFQVVLKQNTESSRTYEVTSRTNILASTNFAVALDDDGFLTSAGGGEDDHTAEIIAAVGGLAVSSAKRAAASVAPPGARTIPKPELEKRQEALYAKLVKFAEEQRELLRLKSSYTTQARMLRDRLARSGGAGSQDLLMTIEWLDKEIVRLKTETETATFPLPCQYATVQFLCSSNVKRVQRCKAKDAVDQEQQSHPWIVVNLRDNRCS